MSPKPDQLMLVPETETGNGVYVGGGFYPIVELGGVRHLVLPPEGDYSSLSRMGFVGVVVGDAQADASPAADTHAETGTQTDA